MDILILGYPAGCEIGIDNSLEISGINFKGYKNITLGVHYLYYGIVNKEKIKGARSGIIFNVENKDKFILMIYKEELEEIHIIYDKSEIERFETSI